MNSEEITNELISFFKTLADANRLKIIGLLANNPLSVEQIAEILGLHSSTVSHHLSRLSKTGLVNARAEGYYNIYSLETKVLEEKARMFLRNTTIPSLISQIDVNAYDRKVLKNYLDSDGKIKAFPVQHKKLEAILRYVVENFQLNHRYSEKEVNQILGHFSGDFAFLRRSLVENKFMEREGGGGEYWRI